VSAFVDTNVLVRHLTGDPPAMARRATRFLSQEDELLVVDLVVAETVYVLESFYETPRAVIAESMRSLMVMPSVIVVDAPLLLRAIDVYENGRIDFAEAYLVACAETTGTTRIASFDKSIDRIGSVARVEP
jgi:predicted nucleic-acid-binding protein